MWNTGHDTREMAIDNPGVYILHVTKQGCDHRDTVNLSFVDANINIGKDTVLCDRDILTLKAQSIEGSIFKWQNGEDMNSISVSNPGIYWVEVINKCGVYTDTIRAGFIDCDCHAFVPTGFTPNSDGLNDNLSPLLDCSISQYDFIIVNRFGEVVFRSEDPVKKWDGDYKGQKCDIGTYYYMLKLINNRGKSYFYKGDITLIR